MPALTGYQCIHLKISKYDTAVNRRFVVEVVDVTDPSARSGHGSFGHN